MSDHAELVVPAEEGDITFTVSRGQHPAPFGPVEMVLPHEVQPGWLLLDDEGNADLVKFVYVYEDVVVISPGEHGDWTCAKDCAVQVQRPTRRRAMAEDEIRAVLIDAGYDDTGPHIHGLPDDCHLCGREKAAGLATVDGKRYCHGDLDDRPTCYEQMQNVGRRAGIAMRDFGRAFLENMLALSFDGRRSQSQTRITPPAVSPKLSQEG